MKQMQVVHEKNKTARICFMSQYFTKQIYDFSVKMLFLGINENTFFIISIIFQSVLVGINIRVTDKKPLHPLTFNEKNRIEVSMMSWTES